MKYYQLVQQGFRILHPLSASYIGMELYREYGDSWWQEVLKALNDQQSIPASGDFGELLDSLDMANCLRLIDRQWKEVFCHQFPNKVRTWAKELIKICDMLDGLGRQDISQADAEYALDIMARLCESFDSTGARDIRTLHDQARLSQGNSSAPQADKSVSKQNASQSHPVDLLSLVGTDMVQRTTLTRKITYAGQTATYQVYRVRLDMLYYNDQNDRISTWITRYRSENGADALSRLKGEDYNKVIENFIYESNPESIQKTQKNIALIGQREPAVALIDGRIVDGNRRYTCLRRLQQESSEPLYLETVIMDVDIQRDKKQIKLLELAIQHGEESKVDYDPIDYAIGTYNDIVKTRLLTIEEYANSTNETIAEVRKRIECAEFIFDMLEYFHLPGQYHVARELQVYAIAPEILSPLHQLKDTEKQQLKMIVFNNVLLNAIMDQRKFLRDIKGLIKNDTYQMFFEDQEHLNIEIQKKLRDANISSKKDIDQFARENDALAEELQILLQRALIRSRKQQLKEKPSEHVSKCISLMTEVDSRMFDKMDERERSGLRRELEALSGIVGNFGAQLGSKVAAPAVQEAPSPIAAAAPARKPGQFMLAPTDPTKPFVVCTTTGKPITRFFVTMHFNALSVSEAVSAAADCKAYFTDEGGTVISDIREFSLTAGNDISINITMRPDSMKLKKCLLVLQSKSCADNEALQLIPFALQIPSGFKK